MLVLHIVLISNWVQSVVFCTMVLAYGEKVKAYLCMLRPLNRIIFKNNIE